MTDTPIRAFGPAVVYGSVAQTLYTCPSTPATKTYIRDITFANVSSADIQMRMSIGSLTTSSNRVFDFTVPAKDTYSFRGLWILDSGEFIQAQQITQTPSVGTTTTANLNSGVDTTAYASANWTPQANTMYLLVVTSGVASGTTALVPSSITGNGTWTAIASTTSTVAAARNMSIAAYYWWSTSLGTNAATTINYASTQHACIAQLSSFTNIFDGQSALASYSASSTPILQSITGADSVAPGATQAGLTLTLPAALLSGYIFYASGKAATTTSTPPSGYTEVNDLTQNDATGSVGTHDLDTNILTTPPGSSTTVGPNTFGTNDTAARTALAFELIPANFVTVTVTGVEVT